MMNIQRENTDFDDSSITIASASQAQQNHGQAHQLKPSASVMFSSPQPLLPPTTGGKSHKSVQGPPGAFPSQPNYTQQNQQLQQNRFDMTEHKPPQQQGTLNSLRMSQSQQINLSSFSIQPSSNFQGDFNHKRGSTPPPPSGNNMGQYGQNRNNSVGTNVNANENLLNNSTFQKSNSGGNNNNMGQQYQQQQQQFQQFQQQQQQQFQQQQLQQFQQKQQQQQQQFQQQQQQLQQYQQQQQQQQQFPQFQSQPLQFPQFQPQPLQFHSQPAQNQQFPQQQMVQLQQGYGNQNVNANNNNAMFYQQHNGNNNMQFQQQLLPPLLYKIESDPVTQKQYIINVTTGERKDMIKNTVQFVPLEFPVNKSNSFKAVISDNNIEKTKFIVKEPISPGAVYAKVDSVINEYKSLLESTRTPLRYSSNACLSREELTVVLRDFNIGNFKKDIILPTEIPMYAHDFNSGFNASYYKKVVKLTAALDATYDETTYYNKLALSLGLYNEKFFNLITYDRVFKRYLYRFILGAGELPPSRYDVYCVAPRLDKSLLVKGSLLYLNRILVCTPKFDVARELCRTLNFKDKAIMKFTGLEGKQLRGVWEEFENVNGLDRIDDVLLLPGGQVRFVDMREEGQLVVYSFGPGDIAWNWSVDKSK